ncbi:hypothetical protein WICPIJ_001164 [Wickerhamomyces pijperi]|uniref:Uncharacterized protein n=1 Tax=Wickerhamomyces pijperi TaxID=599730 RepID=A0A9P8TQW6_WICPI|nr:hypothetical protein WICPIJ_001164 [Wickerhamomyces pijperi]
MEARLLVSASDPSKSLLMYSIGSSSNSSSSEVRTLKFGMMIRSEISLMATSLLKMSECVGSLTTVVRNDSSFDVRISNLCCGPMVVSKFQVDWMNCGNNGSNTSSYLAVYNCINSQMEVLTLERMSTSSSSSSSSLSFGLKKGESKTRYLCMIPIPTLRLSSKNSGIS